MRSLVFAVTALLCAFVLVQGVQAAPVNVSSVASEVAGVLPALALVGGAVLLIWAAVAALGYVRSAMGVGSSDPVPYTQTKEFKQQAYLLRLEARLAAEDAASGVEWRDVGTGKSNLDYEREAVLRDWDVGSSSLRAEAEAAGSDMALYDKYVADDATHSEALRWSNKEANAEIKMPVLGPGWK